MSSIEFAVEQVAACNVPSYDQLTAMNGELNADNIKLRADMDKLKAEMGKLKVRSQHTRTYKHNSTLQILLWFLSDLFLPSFISFPLQYFPQSL